MSVEEVHATNASAKASYVQERNTALIQLVIIGIQAIIIIFLVWLTFVRFPLKEFFWTSNAQAVCKASMQDMGKIHHATLAQFAMEAAVALNSYDFINYRRSLTDATEKYLTPSGRDQYFRALDEAGLIDTVKKGFYIVSAFVSDPPQLREKGTKGKVPFWIVEVPITVWYSAGQQRIAEHRVLTMTIIATDPSPYNPNGIAINNIVSSQRTK